MDKSASTERPSINHQIKHSTFTVTQNRNGIMYSTLLILLFVLLLLGLLFAVYKTEPQAQTRIGKIRRGLDGLKGAIMGAFGIGGKFKIDGVALNYKPDEEQDYVYDLTLRLVNRSSENENLFISLKANSGFVEINPKRLPLYPFVAKKSSIRPSDASKFSSGPFEIRVSRDEAENDKTFFEKLRFTMDILKILPNPGNPAEWPNTTTS